MSRSVKFRYNRFKNVRANMETGEFQRLEERVLSRHFFGLIVSTKKIWHTVDYRDSFNTVDPQPCPLDKIAHYLPRTW